MDHEKRTLIGAFAEYHTKDENVQRAMAVAAALELIRADATGGQAEVGDEMKNLSKYADQIQKALGRS